MQQRGVLSSASSKLGVFRSPSHALELYTAALSVSSNEQ